MIHIIHKTDKAVKWGQLALTAVGLFVKVTELVFDIRNNTQKTNLDDTDQTEATS